MAVNFSIGDLVTSSVHPDLAGKVIDMWEMEDVPMCEVMLPDSSRYYMMQDHLFKAAGFIIEVWELKGRETRIFTLPRTWVYGIEDRGVNN